MRKTGLGVLGICALIAGCPGTPPPPPAAAVLEGVWTVTPSEPGDIEFDDITATFDSNGNIVELTGTTAAGGSVTRTFTGVNTELVGSDVTITVPKIVAGNAVFEGTLSEDQNTMEGSLTDVLLTDDLEIIIPGGDLTFERIVTDPCDGVTCEEGETCVDGVCEADDPCDGVTCEEGETCVDGVCEADDPCDGVTCEEGETCVDGVCEADDPCDGITCEEGETCVDGVCEADDPCDGITCETCDECVDGTCVPLVGDAAAGETYYNDNGCAGCHGADGAGPPSLLDVDCARIFDKLSGVETHVGGVFDVTEQDAADVDAWLDSL